MESKDTRLSTRWCVGTSYSKNQSHMYMGTIYRDLAPYFRSTFFIIFDCLFLGLVLGEGRVPDARLGARLMPGGGKDWLGQ